VGFAMEEFGRLCQSCPSLAWAHPAAAVAFTSSLPWDGGSALTLLVLF
jgi:hypothetical protein